VGIRPAGGTIPTPAEAQAALNAASGISTHTWPQTSMRLSHLLGLHHVERDVYTRARGSPAGTKTEKWSKQTSLTGNCRQSTLSR